MRAYALLGKAWSEADNHKPGALGAYALWPNRAAVWQRKCESFAWRRNNRGNRQAENCPLTARRCSRIRGRNGVPGPRMAYRPGAAGIRGPAAGNGGAGRSFRGRAKRDSRKRCDAASAGPRSFRGRAERRGCETAVPQAKGIAVPKRKHDGLTRKTPARCGAGLIPALLFEGTDEQDGGGNHCREQSQEKIREQRYAKALGQQAKERRHEHDTDVGCGHLGTHDGLGLGLAEVPWREMEQIGEYRPVAQPD